MAANPASIGMQPATLARDSRLVSEIVSDYNTFLADVY